MPEMLRCCVVVASLAALAMQAPAPGPAAGPADMLRPAGKPIPVGRQPLGLAAADFDGDGYIDVAVACQPRVVVLFGDGRGGFPRRRLVDSVPSPAAVAAGDVNRDRRPDLVIAQHDAGYQVAALLGNGRGEFVPAPDSPFVTLASSEPHNHGILLVDGNADGRLDVIAGNAGSPDRAVSVLLGDGQGRFRRAAWSPVRTGRVNKISAAADLDGDGIPELLTTNEASRDLSTLPRGGRGRLTHVPIPRYGHSLVAGDWNRDGLADAAVTLDDSSTLLVLAGDGRGGWRTATELDAGRRCYGLAAGDFDGDGRSDLAMVSEGNTITVLRGAGDGRFSAARGSPFAAAPGPVAILAVDLNADGLADLVVSHGPAESFRVPQASGLKPQDSSLVVSHSPRSLSVFLGSR